MLYRQDGIEAIVAAALTRLRLDPRVVENRLNFRPHFDGLSTPSRDHRADLVS
jgi:hypothetical protein